MSRIAYTYTVVKIFTRNDSPQDGTGCHPSWDRGRYRVALEIQQTKPKFHRLLVLCTQPAKLAQGVPQIHTFTSIPTEKRTSWQCKTKQVRLKRPWLNLDYSQNWILNFLTNNVSFIDGYGSIAFLSVSYIKTRSRTFISRKGMSRLRSTLESKFKSFTARLKYRLVASKAFMGFFKELMAAIALSSINCRPQKITIEDAFERRILSPRSRTE